MIVVDTNILLLLFLPSELSSQAEALVELDPDWAVPILWRSEFRNALATQMRAQRLSLEQALAAMRQAQTWMREREFQVPSSTVLQLAEKGGCTAYDCEFIALALDLRVPCVTQDQALLRTFPEVAISLAEVLAENSAP